MLGITTEPAFARIDSEVWRIADFRSERSSTDAYEYLIIIIVDYSTRVVCSGTFKCTRCSRATTATNTLGEQETPALPDATNLVQPAVCTPRRL